ncbi:hypothetical protein F53441_4995 [Fusarium austroafricanum]|uniref:BZIP domain-containing protein n=1 Tax=Fusarium austroafricanum TaxID=2364996 RepID=A0A8H4KMJ9_9HYPO|nr:hypothetical protein F53441_4995 [Fusarium austroafricanum]
MSQSKSPNYLGAMCTDASKSRRERNREAQQQFRKRRQAAEAARMQRLKQLEGVIERMSTVIVDFADKMLQEDILEQYPALAADVQNVITQVLSLANEAGDPEETNSVGRPEAASPSYRDDSAKERDSGLPGSPFVSQTMQAETPIPLGQQDTMFMNHSSPDYGQVIDPQITYPIMPSYSQAPYLSTIPPSLGTLPWNSTKPLSPTSFTYRLTQSCFNVGYLLLNKFPDSPIPFSDETRMFGSTLRFNARDDMILKLKWLLGPGKIEYKHLAALPWGGRWWDQEFTGTDLLSASDKVDKSALQFCSVLGIERQLASLGAHIVERDTLELDIGNSMDHEDPKTPQPESWSFINFFPPQVLRPKTQALVIRVSLSLLVENLAKICVCLMKGPGFPRQKLRGVIVDSMINDMGEHSSKRICV